MDPLSLALAPWALKLILGAVALGVVLSALSLPRLFFMSRRCTSNYRRWMKQQGLVEVSREDRIFFKGPFFGKAGADSVVFRGVYKDSTGAARKAFLRCGSHWKGLLGRHELEVVWDD